MKWEVSAMTEDGLVSEKFENLSEALNWIPKADEDPETQAYTHVRYEADEDFVPGMGDYALVFGRIVCKIVDGFAGGVANYKLQVAGQWTRSDRGVGKANGTRFIETPIEFWVPEGSSSTPKNFPAPGCSVDLLFFSKNDL